MRDYRFDFANGTTDLVEAMSVRTGYVRYYECLSGGGVDQRIRVESMGGGWQCVLRPGQGFRLPTEESAGIVVTNLSGAAMSGTLKLGPKDWAFEDQRLIGEVSVIDGGLVRTRGNNAFSSNTGLNTSAIANNAGLQLWNSSAAGGRLIVVEQITVFSNFNGPAIFTFRTDVNQLSTFAGFAIPKLAGGASSTIAQLRTQEGTSWTGSGIAVLSVKQRYDMAQYRPFEPIVLPPGFGLSAVDDVNSAIHASWATFEHYEVQL